MTAPSAQLVEVWGMVSRLRGTVELLCPALNSGDLLTARYAAATITALGDQVETALLTLDRAGKIMRTEVRHGTELALPPR